MEFEGGIVPITYCKGGREARREALLNPPLPTDDDFFDDDDDEARHQNQQSENSAEIPSYSLLWHWV